MPTVPADRVPPMQDVTIGTQGSPPRSSETPWLSWLLAFAVVAIIAALVQLEVSLFWLIPGLAVPAVVAVLWFVLHHGLLTWMRLARAPAKALSRGDAAGAERAFAAALARARRFPAHDYRRAMMVVELAGSLKQLGRFSEAKALFEEAVEILGPQWKTRPLEYFIALNNLAVYFIDVQDYAAAQGILEKLLDLTLLSSKGGIKPGAAALAAPLIDLVLHLNLVALFVRMEELGLAADHLEHADASFAKLAKPQRELNDGYHGVRALLLHAQGRSTSAADELDKAQDPDNPICLSVRAKLSLARGDFSQAEQLLRKFLELSGKRGTALRPDLRDQVLELAESLFGSSKYDEAFDVLNEARASTASFGLPATSAWRKALANWLPRAQQLGRTADVAWLEAELHRTSVAPDHAITISPRFRIRPPVP